MNEETINRKHKDWLFKLIFDDKENLLALYKNDLSFIVDSLIMNFYEHQSSFCPKVYRILQWGHGYRGLH